MSADFADIAIVDIDLKKTTWSRVHSSMRTLYLKLSAEPGLDWIRFFREERESRIVAKRHGLWIEDGYIVFDCLLRDVERHHLPDFRLSVAYANDHCRRRRAQRRKDSHRQREDERSEQQQLTELRARVRGAAPAAAKACDHAAAPAPEATPADAALDAKRKEWRGRFRAALTARRAESDHGKE